MIEQALIFALGFLSSALLSLLILPAFWRRAMRLSTRRLEMLMPLSISEVVAQRDQLRAQAAVEQRRIEQKLEAMTRDRARHMSEIGRNAGVIAGLAAEVRALDATLSAREDELRNAWSELGALHVASLDMTNRLRGAEETGVEIARMGEQIDFLRAETATLELQISDQRAQDQDLRQRLAALQQELAEKAAHDDLIAMALDVDGIEPLAVPRAQPDHHAAAN